jgi:hypothetical protein
VRPSLRLLSLSLGDPWLLDWLTSLTPEYWSRPGRGPVAGSRDRGNPIGFGFVSSTLRTEPSIDVRYGRHNGLSNIRLWRWVVATGQYRWRVDRAVGGNGYYVTERPNPDALTHTEIFERLVRDGTGVSGVGPTEPLLTNGELLYEALQELAGMVSSLEVSYQAGSTRLAVRAIDRVGSHVYGLAAQASQVADGFNAYVEAYQEARNRVPPPLPFADQLDTIREHHPGLLAHLPILAQMEEEHDARTREAREAYRKLDQAAVVADAATPEFPLMFEPMTNDQKKAGTFDPTTTATCWPDTSSHTAPNTDSSSTAPAGSTAPPTTPALPSPVVGGPAVQTPGAGSGGSGTGMAPLPPSPRSPGVGIDGLPPDVAGSSQGRSGRGRANAPARLGHRAGGVVESGGGRSGGAGSGGWRAVGSGPLGDEVGAARARAAGVGGRGSPGAAGPGFGPLGAGGRREEDREHKRASYLEADESADSLFGTDQKVAPSVIGATPPPKQYDS